MEYRLAKPEDAKEIYEIVQDTIKKVYPKYYLPEIVDMFCELHNEDNIGADIENGNVYVLLENNKNNRDRNHKRKIYYKGICFAGVSGKRIWYFYHE